MPTVLITGANRGLGLEFAKQYAGDGWETLATARQLSKAAELRQIAAKHKVYLCTSWTWRAKGR